MSFHQIFKALVSNIVYVCVSVCEIFDILAGDQIFSSTFWDVIHKKITSYHAKTSF
jgi:hypothetical protein